MRALHGGGRDNLVVSANLWAGVGLVRGGAGTALVGNPQEEAYRFAELVFALSPIASSRPAAIGWTQTEAVGEIIAKDRAPTVASELRSIDRREVAR